MDRRLNYGVHPLYSVLRMEYSGRQLFDLEPRPTSNMQLVTRMAIANSPEALEPSSRSAKTPKPGPTWKHWKLKMSRER